MAKSVAFLLFSSFEQLDLYGPLSVFASAKLNGVYKVMTVAEKAGPVPSSYGIGTIVDHDFTTCPKPDILVAVGGIGTRKAVDDVRILDFMRRSMAAQAGSRQPYLLTVCTGAALAARAGLLDGKKATTNKAAWAWATSQGQATTWQKEARWVEDGHVWTSAGVTAGMDMSLAFIAKHNGEEAAKEVAAYLEYSGDWRDPTNDPFWHIIDKA